MAKETAEQKLLKLIEGSSSSSATSSASGQEVAQKLSQAVRGQGISGFPIPAMFRSMLGMEKRSPDESSQFSFGLKHINNLLMLVIISIFLFLSVDFLSGVKSLQKKIDLEIDSSTTKAFSSAIFPVKNLADYLPVVEGRNIFQPFEKKVEDEKPVEPSQTPKITTMTEKLKLVGISWIDGPESASAMIEDKESGITYFVRQGEKIKDKEVTVKTIYADRVVFTFEGEEITIKL